MRRNQLNALRELTTSKSETADLLPGLFVPGVMGSSYHRAEFTTEYYCACATYLLITVWWVYRRRVLHFFS